MSDLVSEANAAWCQTFHDGPYTSFKMIDYLVSKADTSYSEFVTNPEVIKRVTQQAIEAEDMMGDGFRETWQSRTGRCTSFAIKVTDTLKHLYPNTFEFAMYDLKGHRLARCQSTSVLVDSSSMNGAFVLAEGEWRSFEGHDQRWKWISGKSKFETSRGQKVSSKTVSPKQAMAICLTDVAAQTPKSFVCLFRSIDGNGMPKYHGMVSWVLRRKRFEMLPDTSNRTKKFVVSWGYNGSEEDNITCMGALNQFLLKNGGPNWEGQWNADGINQINDAIWTAANKAWGYPVHSEEGMEEP